ncbi:MAG: DNA repair exonuclease [Acidobacteria bacterium]|nr:DNA repair exonuclease [Acidobacteriota bacterium]
MVRVLLVADTHLGFDLPARPRSDRPHRGADFFANLDRALAPAHRGEVDLVVHGGDLLYRSRVKAGLVVRALEPLLAVADRGVPVVLVPGNHERSALPYPLLAAHAGLHVLDAPRTVRLEVRGATVALAGFPCRREGIAPAFAALVAASGDGRPAGVRLLCIHQAVEGATGGPADFVFRAGSDVVPGTAIPPGFAAVLAGHIHRHQVLTRDLAGRPLAAPVIYPGSIERTAFAERFEPKGFVTLDVEPDPEVGGRLRDWTFHELPARPMAVAAVDASGLDGAALSRRLAALLADQPAGAAVQLRICGTLTPGGAEALRVASLRRLHPPGMIVSVRLLERT